MAVRATVTAYETRAGVNLIHGVVPVPASWTPAPLFLRAPNGTALPTEQRVAVRGPGGVVRAVELRAIHSSPGGAQTYSVEDGSVPGVSGFHAHVNVSLLSDAPDTQASAQSDPLATVAFSSRLIQAGANAGVVGDVTNTIIRAGEVQSGSLSRLWGYRAHVTTVAGISDVWLVDMSVQNGNVGTPGSPLGSSGILHDLFFNEIRLSLPAGYSITHLHPTPYTSSNRLMTPLSGGKLHALLQGGARHYRFAIHTAASFPAASILLARFGFFVCDHSTTAWSWSNPATAWYGPQSRLVPQKDLSSFNPYNQSYANIALGLATGQSFPINPTGSAPPSTPLGPYHVRGPTDGGPSGGTDIAAFRGYEVINGGSVSKLKTHMAILGMDVDRAASKQTQSTTGVFLCDSNQAPLRVSDWDLSNLCFISDPGTLDKNHTGPWPRHNASKWRLQHAQDNNLLPGYYSQLGGFGLYKDSHLIRAMGSCVPLIWLANDPLAKDYAAHLASWSRAHTLEYGPAASQPQSAGGSLWWSYEGSPTNVQAQPGKGARKGSELSGRIGGWAIFAQMMDWLVTDDDTKRADYAPWLAMLKAHHELAQLSAGSRNWHAMDSYGDHPVQDLLHQWEANGYSGHPNAAASQVIECGIQAGALLGVHAATGDDAWLAMLAEACRGLWEYHRVPGTGTYHFVAPVRPIDITAGGPYATQGAAPDCFTEPQSPSNPLGAGYDNDQVGTLIAAALAYNPAHPEAWAAIYAMTGTSTPEAARDSLASLFPSKMEESWGPVLAFLQDYTSDGGVQVTPSPARIVLRPVAPTIQTEIEVTPSPARIVLRAGPTSGGGGRVGINVEPSPARVVLRPVAPAISAPVEVRPSPARIVLLVPLQQATVPINVEPSPAVVRLRAVDPWDLEAPIGIESTLVARQSLSATLTAAQSVSSTLTATQTIAATLEIT